jgi:mRNA-degrading endonuclease RelE of RelBE toxin-antitoxin system
LASNAKASGFIRLDTLLHDLNYGRMAREPYSLVFDPQVQDHLRSIEAKHHSLIRETIEEQLEFEPETETRNRKPLQRTVDFGATWELRFGPNNRFRVFYTVDSLRHEVQVLAIGVKERNRLTIGGEEIKL